MKKKKTSLDTSSKNATTAKKLSEKQMGSVKASRGKPRPPEILIVTS